MPTGMRKATLPLEILAFNEGKVKVQFKNGTEGRKETGNSRRFSAEVGFEDIMEVRGGESRASWPLLNSNPGLAVKGPSSCGAGMALRRAGIDVDKKVDSRCNLSSLHKVLLSDQFSTEPIFRHFASQKSLSASMDSVSNGLGFGQDPKAAVMNQVRQEAAMTNARQLIEKVNQHCFEKCVPKPGPSLSSGESTCFSQCMDKYMSTWNAVSRQYIDRIQREQAKGPAGGGVF
ncbi:hypothetical protein B2J93_6579 [Marssonina coronariae]|uniref:Mitochondrial import inner membrane translocase subunit TIM13 n=1 Tax=Diplocarpon coronariae TaxID=2795749 RepID=A0A218YZC7_9HELO|nr:hypothetical protein B2J93_6579 [Marssonina coronariae]